MPTPLEQAVALIRAGSIAEARTILIEVLKQNPGNDYAWLCMTLCVTEVEQKRYCFQKVLKINPQNQHAIAGLARLNKPVVSPAQPQVIQQPIRKEILRFSILALAIVLTGIALVIIFVYVFLFLPPGP
jgi:thioredoxin-like negative regulator of GroEL